MIYSINCIRFVALLFVSVFSFLGSHTSLGQKIAGGWMYSYSFDGNAYDIGPNRLHGQLVGGVESATDRFGRVGKALSFNGTDGFVRIPFGQVRNLPVANFTFTVWLFVDKYNSTSVWEAIQSSNYTPIFCKTETDPHFQFRLGASDKGFYFDGGEEGASKGLFTSNGVALLPGKWNMLAVTFNGYVAKYFLNGKLIACENIAAHFIQNNQPLIVGCDFPGQASFFKGKMDDFSIWEKFITEEDVRQIYAVQSKYPFIPPNITVPEAKPVVVVPEIVKEEPLLVIADSSHTTTVAVIDSTKVERIDSIVPTLKDVNEAVFEVKQGGKIVLKHVLFIQSKPELLPESFAELDRLVATMKQNPNMVIEVSGHTDNQGNRDLNVLLSKQRAETVRDYLVTKGVDTKRIFVKGYGPDKPISPNDTEEHRRLNRRVEFEIIKV